MTVSVETRLSPGATARRSRLAPTAATLALALPLAVYACVGWFARYTADDYCWAGILRTDGFLKAQWMWYSGYSPRYAFTFLVNVVELAGPAIVPILPLAAIITWVTTLTWTFVQFGVRRWPALILAEATAVACLYTAPDIAQSLYWQTGMLTYLLPLILATFLIGWLRRGLRHPATPFVALLVTFVGGGLSETYLIPQNVGLTLAFGGALLFAPSAARRALAPHLVAALIGGIAALALIVIAPATALRVGGPPADLRLASLASVATAGVQVLRLGRYFPFAIVLCLLLPALVGVRANACDRRWFWLVTACVTITLPFCYFPSFYAQNGNPPARSLIVPGTIIVAYLLFVGYTFGGLVGGLTARRRTTVLYAASVIPIGVALVTLPEVASAAYHAALWDAEDAQIRSTRDSGLADVVVAGLPSYMGENFVTSNPSDWLNGCVSRYYGIRSIAALPPQ